MGLTTRERQPRPAFQAVQKTFGAAPYFPLPAYPKVSTRMPGPEGRSIDRHTIVHALGRLPQRQRAAIVLRYYEDLPEDTIASVLRCRPATVRSLVARGVQTLRSDLKEAIDA